MADEAEKSTYIDIEKAEAPIATKPRKKKVKRTVAIGQVHILATFNNTIVTFTDSKGGVLTTASAGSCGFRGSKKGTAYAAQIAAEKAGQAAKQNYGFSKADVFIKGIGLGRDAAIRSLVSMDLQVENIKDVTSVAHGGVRPRKARRV
ncbi:MAG TPA: 30S ribosomal protein S11 [Candidatus Saccharimonadales bacterium]|nr:30S ribosomal protein S11 [Candidatus Saccharimonadales bacterium]